MTYAQFITCTWPIWLGLLLIFLRFERKLTMIETNVKWLMANNCNNTKEKKE